MREHVRDHGEATAAPRARPVRPPAVISNRALAQLLARRPTRSPHDERAERLAKDLAAGKAADVEAEIARLAAADRHALFDAAGRLPKGRGAALQDAVRDQSAKTHGDAPMKPLNEGGWSVADKGTAHGATEVAGGTAQVSTDVDWAGQVGFKDGVQFDYQGADSENTRWVQFIAREVIVERPPKGGRGKRRVERLAKDITNSAGLTLTLTTDPAKPQWMLDRGRKSSWFYEPNSPAIRKAGGVTVLDVPTPNLNDFKDLFTGDDPADKITSVAHLVTYLVRGKEVLFRAGVDATWTFTDAKTPAPAVWTVKESGAAGGLDPVHRTVLVAEFPDKDFHAVARPAAPRRRVARRPKTVTDLSAIAGAEEEFSPKRTTSVLALYGAVADAAGALALRHVGSTKAQDIPSLRTATKGAKEIKPGLNFVQELGTNAGRMGFVDGDGAYRGSQMPVAADGAPPKIAILLGPRAFDGGKAKALGVMRHEMEHAFLAEGLLDLQAQWRAGLGKDKPGADAAKRAFATWAARRKLGKIERALLDEDVAETTANTEVLAHAAGFAATFHFAPHPPAMAQLRGGTYPAGIDQLKGVIEHLGHAADAVKAEALKEVRAYCKDVLGTAGSKRLADWLQFLLDRSAREPPKEKTDEGRLATLVYAEWRPLRAVVQELLAIARKP